MIQPGMTKRKRSEHYVNNKEFLAALVEYRSNVELAYFKEFGKDLCEQEKSERAKSWKTKPPKILLLTLRRSFIMRFSAGSKERNVN
jgi:hypothetical protein